MFSMRSHFIKQPHKTCQNIPTPNNTADT